HGDVAAGLHAERVGGGDAGAEDIDVLRGLQAHCLATDGAAGQVVDVVCVDAHQLPPGDVAAVDQVAAQIQVHVGPGQQRAAVVEIAGAQPQVHLRHQHRLCAAVGQRHGLFD